MGKQAARWRCQRRCSFDWMHIEMATSLVRLCVSKSTNNDDTDARNKIMIMMITRIIIIIIFYLCVAHRQRCKKRKVEALSEF